MDGKGKKEQKLKNIKKELKNLSPLLNQASVTVLAVGCTSGCEEKVDQKSSQKQKASVMNGNKDLAKLLFSSDGQGQGRPPQLVHASRIRIKKNYPAIKKAAEHMQQYTSSVMRLRARVNKEIDPVEAIKKVEDQMLQLEKLCEDAIRNKQIHKMVDNTSNIMPLINRVLVVTKQKLEKNHGQVFSDQLNIAANRLEESLPAMVDYAKRVTKDMTDPVSAQLWRDSYHRLVTDVQMIRKAMAYKPPSSHEASPESDPAPPPTVQKSSKQSNKTKRVRSCVLRERLPPVRPPSPKKEVEETRVVRTKPQINQPIMAVARELLKELRQWSLQQNEILADVNRMSQLIIRLSKLIHSDSNGNVRKLIATTHKISESCEYIRRLAKDVARQCSNRLIRKKLLQTAENLPLIGTQLNILSAEKATPLTSAKERSNRDNKSNGLFVANVQNLIQKVVETVRTAEGACESIKCEQTKNRFQWIKLE